ncbi:MAG: NlpC/P60 family protein, partial [Gammaproteobacteria bacterium]|nr:NlpC/P60 family protein [Gammaproteobacteria bacterium]
MLLSRPAFADSDTEGLTSKALREEMLVAASSQALVMQGVVERALDYIGVPYRFGGSSPRGFDCSGLVNYACR